ncbi:MAG: hypothetical protein V1834_03525 [Candidatus Micrarchaeota archaeon]
MKNELLKKTGWSESELEARVKEKQKEFAGLITDEGAVELLARENGLKPAVKKVEKPVSMLGNSREGASVNVNVKVTRVLSPKNSRRTAEAGRYAMLRLKTRPERRQRSSYGTRTLAWWKAG